MRPSPSRVIVLVAAAAALLLAGCTSTVTGSAAPTGGGPSAPGGLAEAQRQAEDLAEGLAGAGGAVDDGLDACTVLSAAEVEALIGPAEGVDAGGISSSRCEWENPDTYDSVTLEIGWPGTAAGGQLPPWDSFLGEERPLGDGMRSMGLGQVEFVAGDRDCFVQVVTEDLGGDADEATAVGIARQVRGEL